MTRMTRNNVLRIVREARESGERPDLSGLDLSGLDLFGVDMYSANLRGANLTYTNLYGGDLRCVDLTGANLTGAYLDHANLNYANLRGANLDGASLYYARLQGAIGWGGLVIDGLHRYRILLVPTTDGWRMIIGCWAGTPDELRVLIAGDYWPEAQGDEITRRRPLLEAALKVVDAHITAHPDVINDLKERWEA